MCSRVEVEISQLYLTFLGYNRDLGWCVMHVAGSCSSASGNW